MTSAVIYARVSSARQKKDETIGSQTAALRAHAEQRGLEVPEAWVFEDEVRPPDQKARSFRLKWRIDSGSKGAPVPR